MSIFNVLPSLSTHPIGGQVFITTGAGTFTVPYGVTNISVLLVGGGGAGGQFSGGGAGGALTYANDISVKPGDTFDLFVGAGAVTSATVYGGNTWFGSNTYLYAPGGGSGPTTSAVTGGGGGGAGGYLGSGGQGGSATLTITGAGSGFTGGGTIPNVSYRGGNGGSGSSIDSSSGTGFLSEQFNGPGTNAYRGGAGGAGGGPAKGGGGVGIFGASSVDANGIQTAITTAPGSPNATTAGGQANNGGSGGISNRLAGTTSRGGLYGGGGGGGTSGTATSGANGAISIIWGLNRKWPNPNVF